MLLLRFLSTSLTSFFASRNNDESEDLDNGKSFIVNWRFLLNYKGLFDEPLLSSFSSGGESWRVSRVVAWGFTANLLWKLKPGAN